KNLDENGIVRVGTEVKEGDILIGKITPKGESDPTPEEKLLRAIFGDKAGDVKDASKKAPPSMKGVVIDTKLFSRPTKEERAKHKDDLKVSLKRYGRDLSRLREVMISKLVTLLDGITTTGVKHKFGDELISKGMKFNARNLAENLFPAVNPYRDESQYSVPEEVNVIGDVISDNWTEVAHTNQLVSQLVRNYLIARSE